MPKERLFRTEVLDNEKVRLFGEVWLRPSKKLNIAVYILIFISLALLGASLASSYNKKLTLQGQLLPEAGVVRVSAPKEGIVEVVMTKVGSEVVIGDPLIVINTDSLSVGGVGLSEATERFLSVQIDEIDNLLKYKEAQSKVLADKQSIVKSLVTEEIGNLKRKIEAQKQQVIVEKVKLGDLTKLSVSGAIGKYQVSNQERLLLQSEQLLSAFNSEYLNSKEKLANSESILAELPVEQNTYRSELLARRAELMNLKSGNQVDVSYTINAPVNGKIAMIKSKVGNLAKPEDTELLIIPKDSKMFMEMYIPSKSAGFIKPGLDVIIKYESFPYKEFGKFKGKIDSISNLVLSKVDLPEEFSNEGPMFIARVAIYDQIIESNGFSVSVQAGLRATCEVSISSEPVLKALLARIFG